VRQLQFIANGISSKMRKPDGWDSKNRKSVSATSVANSASLARSLSPVRVPTGVAARKNRPASSPSAVTKPSSSPLGDVDEPHGTVRTFPSKARRKTLVDDLEDDGGEVRVQFPRTSASGEHKDRTRPGISETLSKTVLKGQKYSNETEPGATGSVLSSDFAQSGLSTLARKRKTPSYSSSAWPAMTPSDDDDERVSDDDDGDEYVDNHPAAALNKYVSARRLSPTLGKRYL
jgi:hypothetical protein